MGVGDLIRLREVRAADVRNDQKSAAQITAANTLSVTQEDYQLYVLSQLKRIIHGDDAGQWLDDFLATGIPSLGTALDPDKHASIRQLIHFVDDGPAKGFATGAYKETTGTPWPVSVIWYVDATKAQKIVEQLVIRNGQQAPTQVTWNMYGLDGVTIIESVVDTITLDGTGVFELARTRAIS